MPDKLNRRGQLTRDTAALLLVDHQVGLYTGVRDIDTLELKHNVVGLTKALRALKIPVVVTTTTEKMWGPLIPELADAARGIPTIERTTVNAWTERRVVDAVKATGRKQLIVTGISTDVCLTFPAISALADGYETFRRGRRVRSIYEAAGRVGGDAHDTGGCHPGGLFQCGRGDSSRQRGAGGGSRIRRARYVVRQFGLRP